MRRFFNYLLIGAFGLSIACSTDSEPSISDKEYLPLHKGVYQIYDVDSTWYAPIDGEQTIHYELMTEVVDSFLNVNNQYTYVMYLYKRADATQSWQYADTWSARIDNIRAVIAEGNTEYVKFVLPVSEGREWDGNTFNSLGEDEYELINTRKPATVDEIVFDDCIEVNQNNDDDPIVRTDIRSEIYARGIGLVRREITILNFCTVGCNQFGEIETGIIYSQRIKQFGVQ
ncbi:MAG TPA: hypothetical protein VFW11_15435 [Cyclobacteriaceae bacterium]|nr:hypothetical protein [Cyclobacteriaceae bacterium]